MAKWEEENLGQAHSTYGLHKAQHSWQISCSLPLHQTFNWKIRLFTRLMEPHFSKRNASFFTATPYAYHRFLDYCCAQLFSRRKRSKNKTSPKISEEHLEISLRMTSTQTDSCISFTKSHISQVLWLCWPPFHVLTKKY